MKNAKLQCAKIRLAFNLHNSGSQIKGFIQSSKNWTNQIVLITTKQQLKI